MYLKQLEVEQQYQSKQFPTIEPQQSTQAIHQQLPTPVNLAPIANPLPIAPLNTQESHKANIAPLPPTGLPDGWTMEQWEHYGWKYIEALTK